MSEQQEQDIELLEKAAQMGGDEMDMCDALIEAQAPLRRLLSRAKELEQQRADVLKQAVDRFLGWTLPKDFSPDYGISFTPHENQVKGLWSWPVGTNLLNADQAREMFEYCFRTLYAEKEKP